MYFVKYKINMEQNSNKEYVDVSREFTSRFKRTQENRLLKPLNIKVLKEQMKTSLKNFPPVHINKLTNNIIDGQHRIEAFQQLIDEGGLPIDTKLSVMYTDIPEEKEKEAIINANKHKTSWSLEDYIRSHRDNPEYKKLEEWSKNHSLCFDGKKTKVRYAGAILKRQNCTNMLKEGSFFISNEDLIKGEEIHDELVKILAILKKDIKGNFIESIALSWHDIRKLHSFKEWLTALKRKRPTIDKKNYSSKKDWDSIFSTVSTSINLKNN